MQKKKISNNIDIAIIFHKISLEFKYFINNFINVSMLVSFDW